MSVQGEFPGRLLVRAARAAIAARLGVGVRIPRGKLDERLFERGACFVTLTVEGRLRGCVGTLEARRPLIDDVEANAAAAAFEDLRFAPLTRDEFESTRVEVSVLGPQEPLPAASEEELLGRLQPGVDGLVLVCGPHRATFLPQVWEGLPEPERFLDQLRRKAGLAADYWAEGPVFFRYRVEKY